MSLTPQAQIYMPTEPLSLVESLRKEIKHLEVEISRLEKEWDKCDEKGDYQRQREISDSLDDLNQKLLDRKQDLSNLT